MYEIMNEQMFRSCSLYDLLNHMMRDLQDQDNKTGVELIDSLKLALIKNEPIYTY